MMIKRNPLSDIKDYNIFMETNCLPQKISVLNCEDASEFTEQSFSEDKNDKTVSKMEISQCLFQRIDDNINNFMRE